VSDADLMALAEKLIAAGESVPRPGRDPVNLPMIHNWVEAMGDANPAYDDTGVAPPAMLQVWTMRGLHRSTEDGDPLGVISQAFADAGFPSIVATNCEQTYHRYLRVGEEVAVRSRLVSVVGPKKTGLGEGYFITTESTWYVGDEAVGTMMFRVLRYRAPSPAASVASPAPAASVASSTSATAPPASSDLLRPVVSRDTAFFWEGMKVGELRIQQCVSCGRRRHPPGPACPSCGSFDQSFVVAAGEGTIFSYVVHHYPQVPGRQLPFVVALVELPEGVRLLAELVGAVPEEVTVGAPVRLELLRVDDELTMPTWRLVTRSTKDGE
jgi:uncharacterized OB-fold protein